MLFAVLFPNIFLLFQFKQNAVGNYLPISGLLLIAASLGLSSLLFGVLILKLFNSLTSLISIIFIWVIFWFFETLYNNIGIEHTSRSIFLVIIGGVVFIFSVLIGKYINKRLPENHSISLFATVFAIVLIFMNFPFGALIQNSDQGYFKTDWNIDHSLEMPNIFWIQMDGMPSLEALETFFEVDSTELKTELEQRGFLLNPNATLNAVGTQTGLPALFSPSFYDDYWHDFFVNNHKYYELTTQAELIELFTSTHSEFNMQGNVANNMEFFGALHERGYNLSAVIQDSSTWLPWLQNFDSIYFNYQDYPLLSNQSKSSEFLQDNLDWWNLLIMSTPFSMFERQINGVIEASNATAFTAIEPHETIIAEQFINADIRLEDRIHIFQRNVIDALYHIDEPAFVYFSDLSLHSWIVYNNLENNEKFEENYVDFFDAGVFSLLHTINLIDRFFPDSVIVIQADHGIHHQTPREYLLTTGRTPGDLEYLRQSTISAVRIPDEYGGLQQPINPHNISRELTNRFIGENYELIED